MNTRTLIAFVIIVTLFSLCPTANAQSDWEPFAKDCTELHGQSALDACNQALSLMPNDLLPDVYAKVYINRGISLGELDRPEEALLSFKKAIQFDPRNAKAMCNMGAALNNLGYLHRALRAYRKSIELDSGIAQTWGNLGIVEFEMDRYREAINAFETAKKIDPSYFTNRADEEETYKEAINNASSVSDPSQYERVESGTDRREYILRFTPSVGWLGGDSNSDPVLSQIGINKKLNPLDYILLNLDMDFQMFHNWFATGSFMYSHAFYKDPVHGGIDIFGIPFGIRYVVLESDYFSYGTGMDRARFWIGASAGPYIKNESITVNVGGQDFHGSTTDVAFGIGAHTGFDYFLNPNLGFGIQVKFQYILFDNDIIMFSGGPSIIGRF